ncbi:hypothetical protein E2P81_ATG10968 [Venturia nashicola]|uniref:Protein BNI4 n=1 Tax=Venturia nashicola TaxID=86259 RepID=A0A4Z1NT35_9PEZI|nr:hypothetical protein E6O75_ATG10643 [Venturia nashicola]TLD27680.1 hypothetical protein E2P81_ATG10968 [Venturia nashicola]
MLHSPPDPYHTSPTGQTHHSSSRTAPLPRGYSNHNTGGRSYSGTSSTPIKQYAFEKTPELRQETRSASNPARQAVVAMPVVNRPYASSSSASNASSTNSTSNASSSGAANYTISKDDSLLGQRNSSIGGGFMQSSSTPDLSLVSLDSAPKPSPDRYRRAQRRMDSNSSVQTSQPLGNQTHTPPIAATQTSPKQKDAPFKIAAMPLHGRTVSSDDAQTLQSSRYRRRSVASMEAAAAEPQPSPVVAAPAPTWSQVAARGHSGPTNVDAPGGTLIMPPIAPHHQRQESKESRSSGGSAGAKKPVSVRHDSSSNRSGTNAQQRPQTAPTPSPRSSSRNLADASKRLASPSPLSQPMSAGSEKTQQKRENVRPATSAGSSQAANMSTPAMQQLHALSERDPNKGMKSRLRRAFSFGSAQELRKASAENAGRAKLQKDHPEVTADEDENLELQGEDAAIAAKQEAGGLGEGIYSGQGNLFGSTDNLSISSTASSASIMLRKMGRGAKKSARSIKGLFRPKSIIGDPAADSAVSQPTVASAEVSLVTVEAEREKVNVNANPHDQPGGGTGFPHLERNSIDAVSSAASDRPASSLHGQTDSVSSRKSIVSSDRERQEVLAAVKKGILKRSNTASPVGSRQEDTPVDVPGTPEADKIERDYFIATTRLANASTCSLPDRPGHASIRNISWNPKVSFHDVHSPNEYDRRGDIATCNRLTPVLAQQIKEELNSFKMEMEVHEESKPHTHFF